jgi:hypothetical protein
LNIEGFGHVGFELWGEAFGKGWARKCSVSIKLNDISEVKAEAPAQMKLATTTEACVRPSP